MHSITRIIVNFADAKLSSKRELIAKKYSTFKHIIDKNTTDIFEHCKQKIIKEAIYMKIKKLIVLFFASLMMISSFAVSANDEHNDENMVTIYTTTDSNNENLGKEVGQLLSEPGIDRVRVIYKDLLHINKSMTKNTHSSYGWSVSFSSPYPPYVVGYRPVARATGQPDGIIRMSQTKSVEINVSGELTLGLDVLGEEFGSSMTETVSVQLSYEQRVPLDCESMTVEAYPEYEVHHFTAYYNGVREGSGTIKYPVGIVYEEIYN